MDREKAVSLLVREIGDQIDTIYALRRAGFQADVSMHVLKETASILHELEPEMQSRYFDTLIETFTERVPPDADRFNGYTYENPKIDLRSKMEAKIMENHRATIPAIHHKLRSAR